MHEIVVLAQALGVTLADDAVDKGMALVDSLPAEATVSVQRDVIAGRPSEPEAQSGAVVRLASEAGVDAPTYRFIYAALLPHELAARRESQAAQ